MSTDTYKLFTDGGARGNPGPAGVGAVLLCSENEIGNVSKYIGVATNNQAEYRALLEGLSLAHKHKINSISCFLDSELIVRQINGEYKVKDVGLKPLYEEVCNHIRIFDNITFSHVPRARNARADELVNKAIDAETKKL